MTQEEFLAALASTQDWAWGVDRTGDLRAMRNGRLYCPLTAVAESRLRTYFRTSAYDDAAVALGVDDDLANDIVSAADGIFDDEATQLRRQLEMAVGL